MFAVELMTGAMFFIAAKMIFAALVLYLSYRIVRKLYNYSIDNDHEKTTAWKEISMLAVVLIIAAVFDGAAAPKITIDTGINRELLEYQTNSAEPNIQPVSPRTQTLQGFVPLKP